MNRLWLLLPVCLLVLAAVAQDTSVIDLKKGIRTKGTLEYGGHAYPCDVVTYDAPPEVVEAAVVEMMKKWGYKGEKKKGFLVYRGVTLNQIERPGKVDAFALVEPLSKKEKDRTKVSLLFTEPGEIADKKGEGKTGAAVATIGLGAAGVAFVDNMNADVSGKHHMSQVESQTAAVAKAEKQIRDLEKEGADLQKKLERLQRDIEENTKATKAAREKLSGENRKLEQLKAKKLPGQQ